MNVAKNRIHDYCNLVVAMCLLLSCLVVVSASYAQIYSPEKTIRVHGLHSLMARSHDPSDVLLTSLDTILNDRAVCCGKDSALEDSALAVDPKSLKDVASKLQGRHLLSDGRPIMVTTEYLAPDAVTAGHVITMIRDQHAALMKWNSHLYIVTGVVYVESSDYSTGAVASIVRKFLLLDTRYSDSRRDVVFTRGDDDSEKVEGLLFVQTAPPAR